MPEDIDVVPLTVTIPQMIDSTSIIELIDPLASLRAIFVERDSLSSIPALWRNSCGFYILFSRIAQDGAYSVYVGKSDRDFTQRLRSHDSSKDYWTTALLVQRNSVENLSSTQSSYLEGALRDVFDQAPHVTCHNVAPTGDSTLPAHERLLMRQVVDATFRMMLMRGYRKSLPVKTSTLIPQSLLVESDSRVSSPPSPPSLPRMSVPSAAVNSGEDKACNLPVAVLQEETVLMEPPVTATAYKQSFGFSSLLRKKENKPGPEAPNEATKESNCEDIFQTLRSWRMQKAREERLSPAYVFDDSVLRALAEQMPKTPEALLLIAGIGAVKKEKYGQDLMKILDSYR